MYPPQFLFVHDPSTSTKTPAEQARHDRLKHRHVQVRSILSRVSGTDPRRDTTPPRLIFARPGQVSVVKRRGHGCNSVAHPKLGGSPTPLREHVTDLEQCLTSVCDGYTGPLPQSNGHSNTDSGSVWNMNGDSSANAAFPFDFADQEYQYLQYYLSGVHEKLLQSVGLAASSSEEPLLRSAACMVQACLENDFLMYALLAHMSTIRLDVGSCAGLSDDYRYRAVAALRTRLSAPAKPDHLVIISLWHLISAEVNRGDLEIAKTHLEGAKAIALHLQESGNALGIPFVMLIRVCESRLAAMPFPSTQTSAS
jgi:hypothetical protein